MQGETVWALVLWVVIGLGLVAYAISGGADLGAGLWSLLARGPRREQQRDAVYAAIAPIWEANHVWLIFVIVVMFSAFSRAFAVLGIALHVPIGLALLGIVFRGAAYAFRAYGIQGERARERWTRVFAWASLVTPVFLGIVVGGVSSGEIRVEDGIVTSGYWAGWTTPFALAVGALSLGLFGMLSAVYLAAETRGELRRDFTRRALIMQGVAAVLAAGAFVLARNDAPELHANLARSSWTWPVQVGTAACAGATIVALRKDRPSLARYTAAGQVALVVIGWGLAMGGHFILPDVSLASASRNTEVMPALVIALSCGAVVLAPALIYLYRVFKRS